MAVLIQPVGSPNDASAAKHRFDWILPLIALFTVGLGLAAIAGVTIRVSVSDDSASLGFRAVQTSLPRHRLMDAGPLSLQSPIELPSPFPFTPITVTPTAGSHTTPDPQVLMDVRDPSLEPFATLWQTEVSRRFHQPVVVLLCHGGNVIGDEWMIQDFPGIGYGHNCERAERALDEEHAAYPDRQVVCLACNPLHLALHDRPWLFYSTASVWCIPDRDVMSKSDDPDELRKTDGQVILKFPNLLSDRSDADPDGVGNIFEFIQAN
jgi:hypothetical protein